MWAYLAAGFTFLLALDLALVILLVRPIDEHRSRTDAFGPT
jgi:hypothetical protein